ncbi:MAG: pentapeptide repeat-containing protein [Planctomycetaceae bacterium]|nr:pentapeptide repeat-containing protein [Planctomycetaceae bacterium]
MSQRTATCGGAKFYKARRIFWAVLMLTACAATARADIWQWQYINGDPSQGVEQSSTRCVGGAGVSAAPNVNLYNRNLTQAYLIGANLQSAYARYTNFTNANLSTANLTRMDFGYSTLTGATLAGATVAGASFSHSTLTPDQLSSTADYIARDLHGIYLDSCTLSGVNLANQNLTSANFVLGTLTNASLASANLTGSQFYRTTLANANLTSANLTNASLQKSTLTGANLSGAIVVGADFGQSNLTADQLYGTASYAARDLHGIGLYGSTDAPNDLTDWNLAGQNLTAANLENCTLDCTNLTGATVAGAKFGGSNLTARGLYSTASYAAKDLHGISFSAWLVNTPFNLSRWNLGHQNLTGADFSQGILTQASFTGATVAEARFGGSNLTANQLYSTASYAAKDLHGIVFSGPFSSSNLAGWNLANQNLTGACFGVDLYHSANLSGANLTGANLTNVSFWGCDFTGADLRGVTGYFTAMQDMPPVTRNTILADGSIKGLNLAASETLTIRNYAKKIQIVSELTLDPTAALQMVFDGQSWGSTISFSGISSLSLAGQLQLTLAPDVPLNDLLGETFKLFDWSGVSHSGQFTIVGDPRWDTSRLYSSGEITFAPEPSSLVLLVAATAGLLACTWRRRRQVA